jgi:hypothetical protein
MSLTPPAGRYLVLFNGSIGTSGVNTEAEVAIYVGGSVVSSSVREIRNTTNIIGLITLSTNNSSAGSLSAATVTVNGSQAVDARMRRISGGSVQIGERVLVLVKIFDQADIIDLIAGTPQGTISHSNLTNLGADDHGQYLRTDGARNLTGNLNFASNQATNVASVNGVVVEAHSSRHAPGGADAVPVVSQTLKSTTTTQTNSGTPIAMNTMSVTPAAGTYLVTAKVNATHGSSNGSITFGLYLGGSLVASTQSSVKRGGTQGNVSMFWGADSEIVTNGSQTVEIRWSTPSGTASATGRYLTLIRKS